MSQKSSRPQHDRSKRIKDFENNNLIQLIEREDGVTLATAAVQLWLSQKPNHTTWTKKQTGIICFVKDYTKKSYFFRLYSLVPHQLWEQEMYTPFSYIQLTKNFHYFASDDCNAGLNFAFDDEAEKFYNIVINKIMSKTRRNNTRTTNGHDTNQNMNNQVFNSVGHQNHNSNNHINSNPTINVSSSNNFSLNHSSKSSTPISLTSATSSLSNKFSTLKKNKKFDKTQIGAPTNFRIVQHVGLTNNDYEINLTAKDETLKMRDILSAINVNGVPINKKTEAFVNSYIKSHGGLERFDEELKKQKAPAPPPVPVTPASTHHPKPSANPPHTRPAPIPNQQISRMTAAPSVPPPPPPPPPPMQNNYHQTPPQPPPPPPLPTMKNNTSNAYKPVNVDPVINSMNSASMNDNEVPRAPVTGPPAPPPPPPPPLPAMNSGDPPAPPPPPPPPMPSVTTPVVAKTTPKPVEPPKPDPRDDLLNSIKGFQGVKGLKPTSQQNHVETPSPDITSPSAGENSILDQLKNELVKRAQFFQNDSDDDDDESDSEWQ